MKYNKKQIKNAYNYGDVLDCDVLMVNHFGTSWNYVITDIEWAEDLERG